MGGDETLASGEVIARVGDGRFGTRIATRTHAWVMDEPIAQGGLDAGPGPYDLLLASLGACTSMTLRFYARREQIPLEDVAVRLRHDRDHVDDCAACAERDVHMEAIYRTITLTGPLTPEQRTRLMEIAEKCPVHRTLTGTLHIHTSEG